MPDQIAGGQLEEVLALVEATVGSSLVGAYLHGSSVAGGLRPDRDLDVLLVTRTPITDAHRRALVTGLLPMSGRGRGRRGPADRSIELASVVRDDVVPWRHPPVLDFLVGDGERGDYRRRSSSRALSTRRNRPSAPSPNRTSSRR
jgi:predicted nucleotidyltransferase